MKYELLLEILQHKSKSKLRGPKCEEKTWCSLTHKFEYEIRMSKSFTKVNSHLMLKFNCLMGYHKKTFYGFSNSNLYITSDLLFIDIS